MYRKNIKYVCLFIMILICAGCAQIDTADDTHGHIQLPMVEEISDEQQTPDEEIDNYRSQETEETTNLMDTKEALIITTGSYEGDAPEDRDGATISIYAYYLDTCTLETLMSRKSYSTYPANAVDFAGQKIYWADGEKGDGYDNLSVYDMKTGESKQLTHGKNRFDELIYVNEKLYANVARQGATVTQPAVYDFNTNTFSYLNASDDDTWHHSMSYNYNTGCFLILTCSDAEMRTHRVAAETHIRPKSISTLSTDFQTIVPLYHTEEFEVRLTRQVDETHILMTADPQMGEGPRLLKLLNVDTEEVVDFLIPEISMVTIFDISQDGDTIYFIGKENGNSNYQVYEYETTSEILQKISLPDNTDTIINVQYIRY